MPSLTDVCTEVHLNTNAAAYLDKGSVVAGDLCCTCFLSLSNKGKMPKTISEYIIKKYYNTKLHCSTFECLTGFFEIMLTTVV